MPVYDYSCRACEHTFDALVRGNEKPLCPACKSDDLERLLSMPAIKSDGTRRLAMRAAKKRDSKQANERVQEQIRYELNHD
jgi:putative FmdB family regulatory protein